MKSLLLTLFLIAASFCNAQKIEKYFDYLWKECEPNSARFYAHIEKTDSGWHRSDYFIHEKKLQMDGTYEDVDCKIANGRFYFFHANGVIESTGNYVHGKKDGLWLSNHPNGMISDSTVYLNGKPFGNSLSWFENGYPHDSAVWNMDGSGVIISWFDTGAPSSAGRYAAGEKAIGKWQFFHKNGKLSALETYNNDGFLADKQYFDERGNVMNDTTHNDRDAEFPGGPKAWEKYFLKGLYFPSQYKIVNGDKAVVVVTFTIDENGMPANVFVSTPFYPAFDKIGENVIKRSPQWIPAMRHNRKIKSTQIQAVVFTQE
jgi:antitoxin component YwqK of YwqJK toxin-antitoxin module